MSEKKPKRAPSKKSNAKSEKVAGEEKREEVIEKVNENIEKAEEKEEAKEIPSKAQIKNENKMLAIFVGILVVIALVFVLYLIFSNSARNFTYNGVKYTITPNGKLTFYVTSIPIISQGKNVNYKIYLYNDPRKLDQEVPFNGNLYIKPYLAINYSNDINCGGDGIISIANFQNLYNAIGTQVIRDPNATCDPQLRYVYVNISVSNETSIQEIAPACYTIKVANCQVLAATERYLTETLQEINK